MGPHVKKRKLAAPVEEISFDTEARQQFLTGFRKRKLARVRHAQEVAAKRAREERIQDRKMMREERKAEYQRAFEEHRRQMDLLRKEEDDGSEGSGSDDDDQDEEWEGIAEPPPVDYEAEYIDEDKYTTVTVEEMDPSREGLLRYENDGESDQGSEQEEGKHTHQTAETDTGPKAAATTKRPKNADKPKKKKKKFRYESREDRKLNHAKQRLSKSKKAKARREK